MTTPVTELTPVKQALLTITRQQERIRRLEQTAREPIAIIGLGCRFPGGADSPEAFWQLLAQGRDAIGEVPPERWDINAFYDPDPDAPGKMNCRQGGFCGQVDSFDATFFNLSPREVRAMDPQQRMLMEVAWEALANANLRPGELYGSRTGVFVGISTLDYYARQQAELEAARINAYYVSGSVLSVAAGRLSYLLGVTGPSLIVDTACSSSLTALHLACQNLRERSCDLALTGGVGLLLTPEPSIAFTKARMLAPDGRCKTFDAAADGYGRGEGCGVVVLKRLADAVQDGDRILALVRGSAVNQNGASGGLTVPSGPAQEAVIRQALANCGLHPDHVDYVEAHGTGTSLGDPIELRALGRVFASNTRNRPLLIGSVKTNLGHLEAAAGIAGVIKVVLALEHGAIPPHLNFTTPTPHFQWDDYQLRVATGMNGWPNDGGERLAGVSSFGFAGSNAHVLIGGPPPAPPTIPSSGATRLLATPTSPYQRQRYWYDQEEPGLRIDEHPLLGRRLSSPFLRDLFETRLQEGKPAFLGDHRVGGEIVMAGAHSLAMMLAALEATEENDGEHLEEVQFPRPLVLLAGSRLTLQLGIMGAGPEHSRLTIASQPAASAPASAWTTHATARVVAGTPAGKEEELVSLLSRITNEGDPDLLYNHARAGGIQLEGGFRPLQQLYQGQGESLGLLKGAFGPGLLDGCFQLSIATLTELPRHILVPFTIARVVMHHRPATTQCWCHARIQQFDSTRLVCRLRLWDTDERLCLSMDGFEAWAADTTTWASTAGEAWRDWLYHIEWRPLDSDAAPHVPTPAELSEALRERLPTLLDRPAISAYGHGLVALEQLSAIYAQTALRDVGLGMETGWRGDAEALAIAPLQRRLFARLLQIAAEAGDLGNAPPEESAQELANLHPSVGSELRVLQRCGRELARVLKGECDPLSLLFPDGNSSELASLYADSTAARAMNTLLAETVAQAMANWPATRPIRILEIGAGTGASTAYLLERLPLARMEYLFSDISPHFTAHGRERFTRYPALRYRTLDIEQDPLGQGFEAQSFDLVVAANVLHATRDLTAALGHVRRLLAPGGLLVLLEGVARQRWLDLIFGLTVGWWRFEDHALRPDYPLLTETEWRSLLHHSGFEAMESLSPDHGQDGPHLRQAVMMARATNTGIHTGQRWLILADRGGCGLAITKRLQALGAECYLAWADSNSASPGSSAPRNFVLNAGNPVAFADLLVDLTRNAPLHQILHLWNLDASDADAEPENSLSAGCQSALHLAQALIALSLPNVPALTFTVRGLGEVPAGTMLPGQAPLWGLAKVIALEHPELHCRRLDLGDVQGPEAALGLYRFLHEFDEPEVSLRHGLFFAPRLTRYRPERESAPLTLSPDGAYLVSGAFGGLGLLLAEWLVRHGARRLLLLGRTKPDGQARTRLAIMEEGGANCLIRHVDVCDRERLTAAIAELEERGTPLLGVFHAAGLLDDGLLPGQSWPRMALAMAPKIQGAWNLHLVTAHCTLDHFVLYSSAAGLLGSASQASHAAGNAFLDALALHRRASGLPGLSIAWGAWAEVGAASRVQEGEQQSLARWGRQGFGTLAPDLAMQALHGLLVHPGPGNIGVLPIDWPQLLRDRPGDSCLAEFRSASLRTTTLKPGPESLREHLFQALPTERSEIVATYTRAQVARILGWPDAEAIAPESNFMELGLDSLSSLELRNRLQTELGCALPTTLTFDYPSVAQLSDFLATLATDGPTAAPPAMAGEAAAETLARLDEISDEDLDPLLLSLLQDRLA